MVNLYNGNRIPINALVIEEDDRNQNGKYEIDPGFINIFVFEILVDGQLRVPLRHLNTNASLHQTYSIRAWISDQPHGSEIFFSFPVSIVGTSLLFFIESFFL